MKPHETLVILGQTNIVIDQHTGCYSVKPRRWDDPPETLPETYRIVVEALVHHLKVTK